MKRTGTMARLLLCWVLLLIPARLAFAHPMGNFSVNHYAKITLAPDGMHLQYFIDLAEIPTYQELQQYNLTPGDRQSEAAFLARRSSELQQGLHLALGGRALQLQLVSKAVIFPPGAGGLPTMKMGYVFSAAYPPASVGDAQLTYADDNYPGHAGWKEVVIAGPAQLLLSSSAPATDRSAGLSNYPTDMLNSPPQQLAATARVAVPVAVAHVPAQGAALVPKASPAAGPTSPRASSSQAKQASSAAGTSRRVPPANARASVAAGSPARVATGAAPPPAMALKANRQGTARDRFTELVTTQHLSLWFLFTAALISMSLGALHALEPGHGKTIVAAYLVGSRGTARHALLLGVIVTAAHTAGVFALGAVTLYASRYVLPEQLYPWLGVLSGLTIVTLGTYMLLRRWTGEEMDHAHTAGQMHGHWFSRSKAAEPATAAPAQTPVSLTQLLTLGITGGIIPCPAALVVLLSAFSLHRIGFGFFLITAFSVGLAAVLIAFGLLMVYARGFIRRLAVDGPITRRWLPIASAAFMTILGAVIAVRGLAATGLSVHSFSQQKLGPALFVAGLGLVLGIRHSTDADHVVAISTIVTRQCSIRGAALIGTLWGLGHTLTIFAVGCLIILGGIVIPPRIGLSMEFSVGIMLILLGILNLTGMMQKIMTRLTPERLKAAGDAGGALIPAAGEGGRRQSRPAYDLASAAPGATRPGNLQAAVGRYGVYQLLRPLAIGLVHGLAGSAAVALLVLSTIHNPLWAIGYLVIFGAGTMLGMMCMTVAMSLPLVYAGGRLPQLGRFLTVASGLVSVCFGTFLVYQLGYLNGLFTSHPHWTPQ